MEAVTISGMEATDSSNIVQARIKKLFREKSATALTKMSQKNDILVKDTISDLKVMGHWMALISISADQFHITFKIQFSMDTARNLVAKSNKSTISDSYSKDFIRELCNVIGGNIKFAFEQNDMNVGISLPLLCRGFDDLFFASSERKSSMSDRWSLVQKENIIYCSSVMNITGDLKLQEDFGESISAAGEVEFF